MDKKLLGFDFIIGNIYVPHENSKYYDINIFDQLSSDIISINCKFNLPICMIGDFNARTATLIDFISDDSPHACDLNLFQIFSDSITNLDLLGISDTRFNCDKKPTIMVFI